MSAVVVKRVVLDDVIGAREFSSLADEYAEESSIKGMPHPTFKIATYRALEASGSLYVFSAVLVEELVGFLAMLVPVIPHYGVLIGVCESLFVAKAHRHTLAGLKLLVAAEEMAKGAGSPGLMVSSPTGHRLCDVLPKMGYEEASRAYYKGFK